MKGLGGLDLDRIAMEYDRGGNNNNSNNPFLDRSKVRILLCDNDVKSSGEVFKLLCECSYQDICCLTVTSVHTARQVIDALNAEGPDIDIILAEVDLPVAKGLKMLKYILRVKELRHIPIIMMSAQDEVSVVVKCLRLGAADYLVKPLRSNELLNLWTHMWRRRRMLGLAEKNIFNYDLDLVNSDPSDANTNSATLFSDDTDDRSRRSALPDMRVSKHREDEYNAAAFVESPLKSSSVYHPDVPGISDRRTGQFSSCPKKSELRVGESSAFVTYVKSSVATNNSQKVGCVDESATQSEHCSREGKLQVWCKQVGDDAQRQENQEAWENYSKGNGLSSSENCPDSTSAEKSCTPSVPLEFPQGMNSKEEQLSTVLLRPSNEAQVDVSGVRTLPPLPYYLSGMMNQVMMPSSAQQYKGNAHDFPKHATSGMLTQYNNYQQCPSHVPVMASFPYYPVNICLQPGQIPPTHLWPSIGSSSSTEVKPNRFERREAALMKFRQKRKDRCFNKKIRYVNRKHLAERRPRVRGQFVRQVNGVNVDLNGQPAAVDDFYEIEVEDEDELEVASRDSSP
ncbi:hypothetical protein HHK36_018406 [Tetracentron sinense]|uniref:Two-component response regulator-like APRR1 n=1 Tax=Tetracentron sinense TaxID=13715 RepID=A0A834YVZ1_TETSI|nr:hypothetical protein HHK36_018406 [Tetracentron sinense]